MARPFLRAARSAPSPFSRLATAAWLACCTAAAAQDAPTGSAAAPAAALRPSPAASAASSAGAASAAAPATELGTVTVTGRVEPVPTVAGWGEVPLRKAPFQASVFTAEALRDRGAVRLADLVRADPGVSDAYNTEGYWDYLTVRGFVIDNRFNYRRDGLPINAETAIPLDNKERVEVLKGTSGLQAGTSAPGGLVNLVVKRPLATPLTQATLAWRERGSVLGALDLSRRFGSDQAFGLRLNVAAERLAPIVRNADGERQLLALAADWRLPSGALLEAEVEHSRRSQPSVPGFSLLGDRVPAVPDPRLSLNNQPWSLPVVMEGNTASLRLTQPLGADWRATGHVATQQLRSQDRLAYAYGCYDAATDVYYADRFCPDGRYDLYDFRSDNERRRTDAAEAALHGRLRTGDWQHALSVGVLHSRVRNRFQDQAYNYVGQGNVDGTAVTPADPTLTDVNTDRDERSTELFARDALRLRPGTTAWLGVRHTRLQRASVRTDGSRPTDYTQRVTTPWLALSQELGEQTLAYASWGRGVESEVAPNRARYTNRGQALPALKSRQLELGLKGGVSNGSDTSWELTAFELRRPAFSDLGSDCGSDQPGGTCTRQADGDAVHRGLEARLGWRGGPWSLNGGVQWLRARRKGSAIAALNGLQPTNVPARSLNASVAYAVAAVPGLSLQLDGVAESRRMVLPDNSVSIPGWARADLGLRWVQRQGDTRLTWRAGVDNAFDRRAWRESPYQFGHAYLFPMAPRTWRLSVEASL